MSNLHEIKAHIGNIEATRKITRAMYLISASKSQRAKKQLQMSMPYFQHITQTMADIIATPEELNTRYVSDENAGRESKHDLYVVLGADKGMAGGYSRNIAELLEARVEKPYDDMLVAGATSRVQLRAEGYRVDDGFLYPVMNPGVYRARDVADLVAEKYLSGAYRAIFLAYTEMLSPLKQEPRIVQLLPLDLVDFCERAPDAPKGPALIDYLPGQREVFDHLVPHYLKGIIYSAFVESFSSEQSARMFAMDNATNNADETINRLTISYNRARQAKITQELTEIIGGIPQEGG